MGRTTEIAEEEAGELRDTARRLARQRVSVLELAAGAGRAAEACRKRERGLGGVRMTTSSEAIAFSGSWSYRTIFPSPPLHP